MQKVERTPARIREAMEARGLRAVDLSNETGIPKATISRYLSGVFEPKSDAIHKIAVVLDVAEMWLWGYDVPSERSSGQKMAEGRNRVIKRLNEDPDFFAVVCTLADLATEEYESIKILLSALSKK